MTERWIGIDGCKAGWIAAVIEEEGTATVRVHASIRDVWNELEPLDRVLIDIPIGFAAAADGVRACDRQARRLLGGRRASSVFPCPTRAALIADSYSEACAANERLTGKRLSRQSWFIAPKIREVDALLRADESARPRIREVHPEVLFWALDERRPMENRKGSRAGLEERISVLQRFLPDVRQVCRDALDRWPRSQLAADDVLDALAGAVTGRLGGGALRTIPEVPPMDDVGLRTEMVYWLPGGPER